ncbi:MAG: hypothetical protein PHX83_10165 [Acidobacteriia bacterium]|nr:hypothetical protein [Terriglobia bacterium]
MWKEMDRRIRVLLVTRDSNFLDRWMDLCGGYHCSVFHVSPRLDGLFRNLSGIDFDIVILSLARARDLRPALEYLEEISQDCVVIPCAPERTVGEDVPVGDLKRCYLITPSAGPSGEEEALILALRQVCGKRELTDHAAA